MAQPRIAVPRPLSLTPASSRLLRNTYLLLSMTLLFSAAMTVVAVAIGVPQGLSLVCSIGALLVLWLVLPRYRNSVAAVPLTFIITGLLGFSLGPMLTFYLGVPNGPELVLTAAGSTGIIFLSLSGYVLISKKDFSFIGSFLFIGLLVAIGAMLVNLFLAIPTLFLVTSAMLVLLMSGFILYDTSRIIHGGETNYVFATIALYLDILILFQNLLHLIYALTAND